MTLSNADLDQVEVHLAGKYFLNLIKKHAILTVLGGAVSFLGLASFASYKGAAEALKSNAAQETLARLKETESEAQAILKRLKETESSWTDGSDGWTQVGDTLICWGEKELSVPDGKHTVDFQFAFSKEFESPPTVADSIRSESTGHTYNIFNHTVATDSYSGSLTEVNDLNATKKVKMSFVAIGKPSQLNTRVVDLPTSE